VKPEHVEMGLIVLHPEKTEIGSEVGGHDLRDSREVVRGHQDERPETVHHRLLTVLGVGGRFPPIIEILPNVHMDRGIRLEIEDGLEVPRLRIHLGEDIKVDHRIQITATIPRRELHLAHNLV